MQVPPLIVDAAGSAVARWVPIADELSGRGPCWRAEGSHVKHRSAEFLQASADVADLEDEAAALQWLDGRLVVPVVRALAIEDSGDQWLVTETADGVVGSRGEELGDIGIVAALLGSMLAELHALPRADFSTLDSTRSDKPTLAARIEDRLSSLDSARLPDPYNRYRPEELYRFWTDAMPDAGDGQHQVLCHGNPVLSHAVFRNASSAQHPLSLSAVLSPGGLGVGDRHLDLARAQLSIHHHYGAEAVFAFYDGYGSDVDLVRLDHAVLTHHLLASRLLPGSVLGGESSSNPFPSGVSS